MSEKKTPLTPALQRALVHLLHRFRDKLEERDARARTGVMGRAELIDILAELELECRNG